MGMMWAWTPAVDNPVLCLPVLLAEGHVKLGVWAEFSPPETLGEFVKLFD